MRHSSLYLMLIAAAVASPTCVRAQQPAGVGITPATYNLINCAIAQNAGDVRWLNAIAAKSAGLSSSLEKGAQVNAIEGMLYGCAVQGADLATAVRMSVSLVKFHPNSENRYRPTYELADCLAKTASKEAMAYLEESDKVENGSGNASSVDYNSMFKASSNCGTDLDKLKNNIQANELYSRLNWILRAQPALAAQQTKVGSH